MRNSSATIGTLSGADAISQIWWKFISVSNPVPSFQTLFRSPQQPMPHVFATHFGLANAGPYNDAQIYCMPLGRKMTGRCPFSSLISDSSMTGDGPEIPPSLRTRQKCKAMKMLAINGIAMQCQMYARKSALASTIDPPNNAKRTSLYGVIPSSAPNGPSVPKKGVAGAMFVPTVTAQKPN